GPGSRASAWGVRRRQLEPVAHAGLGHDVDGERRVRLELASQVREVHAEVLRGVAVLAPPHGVEELLVRERPPRLAREHAYEPPLDGGEVHLMSPARRDALVEVELEVAEPHDVRRRLRLLPASA